MNRRCANQLCAYVLVPVSVVTFHNIEAQAQIVCKRSYSLQLFGFFFAPQGESQTQAQDAFAVVFFFEAAPSGFQ